MRDRLIADRLSIVKPCRIFDVDAYCEVASCYIYMREHSQKGNVSVGTRTICRKSRDVVFAHLLSLSAVLTSGVRRRVSLLADACLAEGGCGLILLTLACRAKLAANCVLCRLHAYIVMRERTCVRLHCSVPSSSHYPINLGDVISVEALACLYSSTVYVASSAL